MEFFGKPMALFVLIGFREDYAEGAGLFETGANIQGLVKYIVYTE